MRELLISQKTINEWKRLSTDYVTASSVNTFKTKIDKYTRWAGYTYTNNCWAIEKPIASLSTCHLAGLLWMAVVLIVLIVLIGFLLN